MLVFNINGTVLYVNFLLLKGKNLWQGEYQGLLSSPELKTQVSFSDHNLSVVVVIIIGVVVVNFSLFLLLLQNH